MSEGEWHDDEAQAEIREGEGGDEPVLKREKWPIIKLMLAQCAAPGRG